MNFPSIIDYFRTLYPMTPSTAKIMEDLVATVFYSKGQILAHPGGKISDIWFIQHGIIKSYHYHSSGKAVIHSFWQDNDLVVMSNNIFGHKRCSQYIEVIENSRIEVLDAQQFIKLSENSREVFELAQQMILLALNRMEEKVELISYTAEQRYHYFTEHFPWSRISVADIAAYLGLTRETVSQIRNKSYQIK